MRCRKPNAKLTPDQVREILLSEECAKLLAYRYGVTPTTIWHIRNGKTWRDIPWPEAIPA